MSKDKVFPIRNSAACVYKWSWNTFRMYSGQASSCSRMKASVVDPVTFENFHNSPEVINDRRLMLNDQWPVGRGCEYCHDIEEAGGMSDRIYHNDIPGLSPVEFHDGSTPLAVTPRISEIYIDNTCDLACVYCMPMFSSRINQEVKKFGPYPNNKTYQLKSAHQQQYFDLYINWLDDNYIKLRGLSVLGGEPFLQKELWTVFEHISQKQNAELELQITTNLNAPLSTIKRYVDWMRELLDKGSIGKAMIRPSLDCWGPQAEFVRYGLDLQRWQENLEFLLAFKWLDIEIHQVVCALTLPTMQDLQDRIIVYKNQRPDLMQAYHYIDGAYSKIFNPSAFEIEFFEPTFQKLIDTYPVTNEWDKRTRERLVGVSKSCLSRAQHQSDQLQTMVTTLDMLDHRRGTDWKSLYPEICDYLKHHAIIS